jgi:hypothetical protein
LACGYICGWLNRRIITCVEVIREIFSENWQLFSNKIVDSCMKFIRAILPLIAAFHLVIATSGVPLAYMFCGETFCSWSFATTVAAEQQNEKPENCDVASCCADMAETECHTELHLAQLPLDALQAASYHVPQAISPLIAFVPIEAHTAPIVQTLASHASFLDKPPPRSFDRTIRFRSLLI